MMDAIYFSFSHHQRSNGGRPGRTPWPPLEVDDRWWPVLLSLLDSMKKGDPLPDILDLSIGSNSGQHRGLDEHGPWQVVGCYAHWRREQKNIKGWPDPF